MSKKLESIGRSLKLGNYETVVDEIKVDKLVYVVVCSVVRIPLDGRIHFLYSVFWRSANKRSYQEIGPEFKTLSKAREFILLHRTDAITTDITYLSLLKRRVEADK